MLRKVGKVELPTEVSWLIGADVSFAGVDTWSGRVLREAGGAGADALPEGMKHRKDILIL